MTPRRRKAPLLRQAHCQGRCTWYFYGPLRCQVLWLLCTVCPRDISPSWAGDGGSLGSPELAWPEGLSCLPGTPAPWACPVGTAEPTSSFSSVRLWLGPSTWNLLEKRKPSVSMYFIAFLRVTGAWRGRSVCKFMKRGDGSWFPKGQGGGWTSRCDGADRCGTGESRAGVQGLPPQETGEATSLLEASH